MAVSGTKSVSLRGAEAQPQLQSTAEDEDVSTLDKPAKRKTTTSQMTSPERTHKDKRLAVIGQQVIDYGEDRVIDPLGGQAHVQLKVKDAAVSDWLHEQSSKPASAVHTHAKAHDDLSHLNQTGSIQALHFDDWRPELSFDQTHAYSGFLLPPASFLPSQQVNRKSTKSYQQHLPFPPADQNQRAIYYGATASSGTTNLPNPPLFGRLPSMTVSGPMHYDQMHFQMQTLRQQNETSDLELATQNASRNRTGLSSAPPPFGASGPLHRGGQSSIQTQGHFGMPSLLASSLGHLGPSSDVLLLRVHSNTYDKNGQPIFSLLRMCASEVFGPRLDAYCANRGKEYGVDWMFVYRYQISTHQNPGHDMQIRLTWDMTPADVKIDDMSGIAMRNMDTIYVMKAKDEAAASIQREVSEGCAVQSTGPQVSHQSVDITNGETRYFQNPDITRQWYQALQKENVELRASHSQMQAVVTRVRQELVAKKQQNTELITSIDEITKMSKEYREMVQRRDPNLSAPGPCPQVARFTLSKPPSGRVDRQRPAPLDQPVEQRPSRIDNSIAEHYKQHHAQHAASQRVDNDFVKKCEAVRDPNEQVPQQLQPIQFPSFEGGVTVPDFSNDMNMDLAFGNQMQDHGSFLDAADEVEAESGVEEMTEE
ncbi:hypothetical protein E8E12_004180 [Didymella heteroderae]|uniref:Uncharacterized protein n=1 Tax=Didymella heteroderae TaxID=1769908 RepID=A0A9P5BZK0_9PLEO|nr:hypothetical protein E8E12_004180 [Didymella heteroderae]